MERNVFTLNQILSLMKSSKVASISIPFVLLLCSIWPVLISLQILSGPLIFLGIIGFPLSLWKRSPMYLFLSEVFFLSVLPVFHPWILCILLMSMFYPVILFVSALSVILILPISALKHSTFACLHLLLISLYHVPYSVPYLDIVCSPFNHVENFMLPIPFSFLNFSLG